MAQMVKAVRMILGRESFGSLSKQPFKRSVDIEVEDDAPKRKPSVEEIDALEVKVLSHSIYILVALYLEPEVVVIALILVGDCWLYLFQNWFLQDSELATSALLIYYFCGKGLESNDH